MKPILLTLLALTTAVVADKTCTPSFDYCANTLIKDKGIYSLSHRPGQARPEPLDINAGADTDMDAGFTKEDVKSALKDTDFKDENLDSILLHCKNPGVVGHAKLCKSACKDSGQEGSHSC